ncbi:GGDEF domain-containing protein [Thermoleophilia bacterium SCSIO 60948]|nr:GGDEF domain-containing protein [Thermoleophilia bacterium SCSIO 60948]
MIVVLLALPPGIANAQLLEDIGETTDSLSRGELNVLPGTQESLRGTVDRVTAPLRQVVPQPEPEPAPTPPPSTSPVPQTPGDGIDASAPPAPDTGASSSGSETDAASSAALPGAGSPDAASAAAGADRGARGSEPTAERRASEAASENRKRVDGGKRGRELSSRKDAPKLRDAIVNVIEALPSWARAALLALTVLLMAAVSYLILTWRRLLAAERLASTDRLTGLPNRTSAEDNLGRMLSLAERHRRPMSVALFDLDHFKQINDTHGHQAGDAVLRAVGEAAGSHVRGSDLVARFGGEEFIVLLPDTGIGGATSVAEKLRERIAALVIPEVPGGVSASFGVACRRGTPGESSGSDLIARADRGLYAAKDAGRNRVVAAGDEQAIRSRRRRETVGAA